MPSIEEIKSYLGIDYDDEYSNKNICMFTELAKEYLEGILEPLPQNDKRVKQLALFIIEDLYERNSTTVKENATIEKLKNDFIMQLQCEVRNGKL